MPFIKNRNNKLSSMKRLGSPEEGEKEKLQDLLEM